MSLIYSTDSGRTFHGMVYMKSFDPFRDSKDYTMAVTSDALYVAEQMDKTTPMSANIRLSKVLI